MDKTVSFAPILIFYLKAPSTFCGIYGHIYWLWKVLIKRIKLSAKGKIQHIAASSTMEKNLIIHVFLGNVKGDGPIKKKSGNSAPQTLRQKGLKVILLFCPNFIRQKETHLPPKKSEIIPLCNLPLSWD